MDGRGGDFSPLRAVAGRWTRRRWRPSSRSYSKSARTSACCRPRVHRTNMRGLLLLSLGRSALEDCRAESWGVWRPCGTPLGRIWRRRRGCRGGGSGAAYLAARGWAGALRCPLGVRLALRVRYAQADAVVHLTGDEPLDDCAMKVRRGGPFTACSGEGPFHGLFWRGGLSRAVLAWGPSMALSRAVVLACGRVGVWVGGQAGSGRAKGRAVGGWASGRTGGWAGKRTGGWAGRCWSGVAYVDPSPLGIFSCLLRPLSPWGCSR